MPRRRRPRPPEAAASEPRRSGSSGSGARPLPPSFEKRRSRIVRSYDAGERRSCHPDKKAFRPPPLQGPGPVADQCRFRGYPRPKNAEPAASFEAAGCCLGAEAPRYALHRRRPATLPTGGEDCLKRHGDRRAAQGLSQRLMQAAGRCRTAKKRAESPLPSHPRLSMPPIHPRSARRRSNSMQPPIGEP